MPTLREIAEPINAIFTTVLPVGQGICEVCHGAPNPGYTICYSCHETTSQVTSPVQLVVPISLSRVGEQLRHRLGGEPARRLAVGGGARRTQAQAREDERPGACGRAARGVLVEVAVGVSVVVRELVLVGVFVNVVVGVSVAVAVVVATRAVLEVSNPWAVAVLVVEVVRKVVLT